MIRVILADDHAVMRDGLRHILETAGGFEIVGEASDGSATLALVERGAADVLLLDLSMPAPAATLPTASTSSAVALSFVR